MVAAGIAAKPASAADEPAAVAEPVAAAEPVSAEVVEPAAAARSCLGEHSESIGV